MQFLQACYLAGEQSLAKKIEASVKKDLQQQLQYYNSLGELSMNDETLAANALSLLRNQGSELGDRQAQFANDILSSYQLLRQMDDWKKGN